MDFSNKLKTPQKQPLSVKSKSIVKRGLIAFAIIVSLLAITGTVIGKMQQDRLDKNNTPILFSQIKDSETVKYHASDYGIQADISGVSMFASTTINDEEISTTTDKNDSAKLSHKVNLKEGENIFTITTSDGKRSNTKKITIYRQTKSEYDREHAKEEAKRKAEEEKQRKVEEEEERKRQQLYSVQRVIDGDTIDILYNGKTERVRMIGLDTPETKDPRKPVQCFGREASQKMTELVGGKSVRIEQDPSQGERDKYGRLLLYIFLEDGTNVAKKMIADGFANEYTYRIPYKYQSDFKNVQKTARENKLGLWSDSTCAGDIKKPAQAPAPVATPKPAPAAPAPQQQATACPANCRQARAMGMTRMTPSHQCYQPKLDRDRDGIACE